MQRWKFSREFTLEAVRLVKDRGVAVAQAARDLDLHENVLRNWVREARGGMDWCRYSARAITSHITCSAGNLR
jgi:transposase-like protein